MATSHCGVCGRVSPEHPLGHGGPWLIPHKPQCPWAYAAAYRAGLEEIAKDARGAKGKARQALSYSARKVSE